MVESKAKKSTCEAKKQDENDHQHDLAKQQESMVDLVATSELARHQSGLFDHQHDTNQAIYPDAQSQPVAAEDMANYLDAMPTSREQLVR